MTDIKIIRNCMAFLERVQLQWNEKEAATEVQNWLIELAKPTVDETDNVRPIGVKHDG